MPSPKQRRRHFLATFPNWLDRTYQGPGFDGVRLYGGQWQPGTLAHLQDELMATSAVSMDLLPSSTQLIADLGVTRGLKTVAIPDANITRDGQVRVEVAAHDDPSFASPVADTGWVDYWHVIYPLGTLPSWHPSWKDGKMTAEERSAGRLPWFHIFDDGVLGRYVRLSIRDIANPDGYVAIPRLFIAGGWQASINFVPGHELSYEATTEAMESWGGTKYYNERPQRIIAAVTFPLLPTAEAFAFPLQMQRWLGTSRQLFIALDPSVVERRHENSFLATIRQASPIESATAGLSRTAFVFEGVI